MTNDRPQQGTREYSETPHRAMRPSGNIEQRSLTPPKAVRPNPNPPKDNNSK